MMSNDLFSVQCSYFIIFVLFYKVFYFQISFDLTCFFRKIQDLFDEILAFLFDEYLLICDLIFHYFIF